MSHECHDSCSHGHSHEQSCGENCCACHNCQCACHNHQQEKYSHELLELADEAWMEVLKEKIKDHIRQISGDRLTKMAELVSTSNHARWKEKMQEKKDIQDFEERLHELLFNMPCGTPKK